MYLLKGGGSRSFWIPVLLFKIFTSLVTLLYGFNRYKTFSPVPGMLRVNLISVNVKEHYLPTDYDKTQPRNFDGTDYLTIVDGVGKDDVTIKLEGSLDGTLKTQVDDVIYEFTRGIFSAIINRYQHERNVSESTYF